MNITALIELPAYIGIFLLIIVLLMLASMAMARQDVGYMSIRDFYRQYRSGAEKGVAFQGPIGLMLFLAKAGIVLLIVGLLLIAAFQLFD